MKPLRVYADTSVFGGCFDDEFSVESRRFFDEVRQGRFLLVVSEILLFELRGAPVHVREVLTKLPTEAVEVVENPEEVVALRDAYLSVGILTETSSQDATHVAAASVADADLIVSWNFKHIVHFEKIRGFHAVNLLKGYRMVEIYSPKEVVGFEEENI